jgi:transposase
LGHSLLCTRIFLTTATIAALPRRPRFFSPKDHKGAALIYPCCQSPKTLIADKGYDSGAFREALAGPGITPCIPPRARRRWPATYCRTQYRQRHRVENMLSRLKDWRRISTRYDRCPHTFFSAICIAATSPSKLPIRYFAVSVSRVGGRTRPAASRRAAPLRTRWRRLPRNDAPPVPAWCRA